jgi:hypothetical protein
MLHAGCMSATVATLAAHSIPNLHHRLLKLHL